MLPNMSRAIHTGVLTSMFWKSKCYNSQTVLNISSKHYRSCVERTNLQDYIQTASLLSAPRKMVKDNDTVIEEFNELVNMSAKDLQDWLGQDESAGAGWSKDDGSGETIGHDSGRKIVAILEKNPKKDPSKYEQDDIDHMRKVVAYCKRHLAQEEKAKQDTNSKSYKSLKNWGHEAYKA
ncbi:uncharacterized protein EKO05_0008088 [Ascochyta rabiei]|uniref:Uncharacterized protein n=1 Tax=Didymella rabiei TaxID=5454 RepID=A0A163ACY4_DIDRA|nr:uncharacterized protein EKO05_0008088 [Ascochyta rabiei]KZM21123.1 hypothetical protein ST47_g7738 [Ascochyta rabiei]UPX17748.1 hypothetical protein EKO05_0008088 [Ascochyta rabiei]